MKHYYIRHREEPRNADQHTVDHNNHHLADRCLRVGDLRGVALPHVGRHPQNLRIATDQITVMFSLKLIYIFLAYLTTIAVPATRCLDGEWSGRFAFCTRVPCGIFAAALAIVVSTAVATVMSESLCVANENHVKSFKSV